VVYVDRTEKWLQANDPIYKKAKDRKKLEYSYLTARQLKRILTEREMLTGNGIIDEGMI
jgi:hypothetical protein